MQLQQEVLDGGEGEGFRDHVLVQRGQVGGDADSPTLFRDRDESMDPLRSRHGLPDSFLVHPGDFLLHVSTAGQGYSSELRSSRAGILHQLNSVLVSREESHGGLEQAGEMVSRALEEGRNRLLPAMNDCLEGVEEATPNDGGTVIGDDVDRALRPALPQLECRHQAPEYSLEGGPVVVEERGSGRQGNGGTESLEVGGAECSRSGSRVGFKLNLLPLESRP